MEETRYLKGSIHIDRIHSNREDDYIVIEVEDELSGCRAIEIKLSLVDFADTLTGRGYVNCLFTKNSSFIGMKVECRIEDVPVSEFCPKTEEAAQILKEYEEKLNKNREEGATEWKGSLSDMTNHHRMIRMPDGKYRARVHFTRFVTIKTEDSN